MAAYKLANAPDYSRARRGYKKDDGRLETLTSHPKCRSCGDVAELEIDGKSLCAACFVKKTKP